MLPDMPPGQVRACCAVCGPERFLKLLGAVCASAKMMKAFNCLWMTMLAFMSVLITANGRSCRSPQHVLDAAPTAAPEEKRIR